MIDGALISGLITGLVTGVLVGGISVFVITRYIMKGRILEAEAKEQACYAKQTEGQSRLSEIEDDLVKVNLSSESIRSCQA